MNMKDKLIQRLKKKSPCVFDSWVDEDDEMFHFLKNKLGVVSVNEQLYQVLYTPAQGMGMGACPAIIVVKSVIVKEII